MKRTWILALAAALAIPTAALADSPKPEPVPAWCGGSYGGDGTNFGECVSIEQKVQVAGQSSGIQEQTVSVPTKPEYPSTMVSFQDDRAVLDTGSVDKDGKAVTQELSLTYARSQDRAGELQGAGDGAGEGAAAE